METRRICPKCRKRFSRDEVVCEDCGEQLIDAASDFEASFSMVKEPVLLSNGHDVKGRQCAVLCGGRPEYSAYQPV